MKLQITLKKGIEELEKANAKNESASTIIPSARLDSKPLSIDCLQNITDKGALFAISCAISRAFAIAPPVGVT